MKRKSHAGITSVSLPLFIVDTSSATGAGLSGLVFNTGSLVAEYRRQGQSSWTSISLVTNTLGTYASGGFIADGSLAGAYEFCPPDAALAASARWVAIRLYGATNMKPVLIEIELDAADYQDGVRFGLSALPNAAPAASGGLPTVGTGSGQISPTAGGVDVQTWLGHAVTVDTNNAPNVSAKYLAGTALTGRDIGASVLLSSGTGTGQLSITSGIASVNTTQFLGHAVTVDANNLPIVDVGDWLGHAVTVDANNAPNVSAKYLAGTALTGRDIGLSVLLSSGTGTGQLLITSGIATVNAIQFSGQAVMLDANNYPGVNVVDVAGQAASYYTGQATAGGSSTITLQVGETANPLYRQISLVGGTGAGQAAICTAYNAGTRVATVSCPQGTAGAWATNPDSTTLYAIDALSPTITAGRASVVGPFPINTVTPVPFQMFLSGSQTPYTGLSSTITGTYTIGATTTACTGAFAQSGSTNHYTYTPASAAELNGTTANFTFSAATAADAYVTVPTTP